MNKESRLDTIRTIALRRNPKRYLTGDIRAKIEADYFGLVRKVRKESEEIAEIYEEAYGE